MWVSRALPLAVGALLIVPAAGARAQETGARQVRLGVADAVARAVVFNEDVLIVRAERARTEGIVREVRSQSLPSIEANFNYTRNIQRPVIFFNTPEGVQQISIGNDNDYTFGLRLEQNLLDFSLGPARRAAALSEDATAAQVEAARTDAAFQARVDYYTVLLDDALLRVQEQALEQAAARLEDVETKFRAGTVSEFEVLTAQVEVDNIRPQVIEARNRLVQDRDRLKRTLSFPLDVELVLTDSLAEPPPTLEEGSVEVALLHRADLQAQRLAVDLNRQNLAAQKADALPSFDLFASLQRRGSSDQFFPGEEDFSQSTTAGLQFSVPLFDGRERAGRVQQAEAAVERERYRLEQLEGNVRLEVQQARQGLESAREQVEASRSNVRRAERALEIAQTRFRNGLSTQLELNDAELAATQARTNYAQALYSYNVARARLQAAVGER